jgi:methionyl-tRNA synthetase
MAKPKKILVTNALPYANGPLHLGHIMEAIQADIWVRFQRLIGNECYYVCADDAHGTPIMLKALGDGIAPEALIDRQKDAHIADYQGFGISYDNYYSTHSEYNRELSEQIYLRCRDGGHIAEKNITQAYDPKADMFLSDRYIIGQCPKCGAADQYGDNCEQCGANYNPFDLKSPRSSLSGAIPVARESLHYFFTLSQFGPVIENWLARANVQPQVCAKLREWLDAGLQDWDISRDAPYFGFEIPGAQGKYFYVWLDAPIGYMAAWRDYCERKGLEFNDWWHVDSQAELHHFIGKDIINFHGLFWPALLSAAGYRMPSAIFAHGFLNVNGDKMSKSRNTFILASDYLRILDAEYLRYYFAAKLDSSVRDIDLNMDDFRQRVNADIVGNVINIASRCAPFISKHGDGRLVAAMSDSPLKHAIDMSESIAHDYQSYEYASAMRAIGGLAQETNRFIDKHKPWVLARENPEDVRVQEVCSTGIALFRLLVLYLKPVMPELALKVEQFLGEELRWEERAKSLQGQTVAPYQSLMTRVEKQHCEELLRQHD